jgi:murein DD-endopeptidase MepM/ murein hydrolase activator NlpD
MPAEDAKDVTLNSMTFEGKTMRVDVSNAITAANIKRTIDGAPTLSLTLYDPFQKLVTGGFFAEQITVQIDGKSFILVQLTKSGSMLTVVFEDIAINAMRRHTDPVKVEANTMTRFDFAKKLLEEDGTAWIPIYMSPGATLENTKVELARGTVASSTADTGVNPNLFSGSGVAGTGGGAVSITDIARYAAKAGFTGDNLVIAVAVSRAENGSSVPDRISPPNTNGTYDHGLWQINSVHKDLFSKYNWKDPQQNAIMAYEIFKGSGWKAWSTYTTSNASRSYKGHMAEAQAAVSNIKSLKDPATGEKLTASQRNKSTREALLGGAEDTWSCIKRIFSEINWTCYIDWDQNNVPAIYVGPDDKFLTPKAEIDITPEAQGVDSMDYDYDIGKSTATMTLTCRAHRWQLPPGTMVNVPMPGHLNPWLVSSVDRSFFSLNCTVTLKKPEPALPEPEAPEQKGDLLSDLFTDGGSLAATEGLESTADIGGGADYSWPVSGDHKITDRFGSPRPKGKTHQGVDIGVPLGTPVYASRDGVIQIADEKYDPTGYGKLITIGHRPSGTDNVVGPFGLTETTYYAHLSVIAATRGQQVKKGALIGKSGQSGNPSGPCLHFEIRKDGVAKDPIPYLSKPAKIDPNMIGKKDPTGQFSYDYGTQPNSINKIPIIP